MDFKKFNDDYKIDEILKMLLDPKMLETKINESTLNQIGSFLNVVLDKTLKIDEGYVEKTPVDNRFNVTDMLNDSFLNLGVKNGKSNNEKKDDKL